jgi:hypothetical protein
MAALGLASAATSMAQVYSVNVVGYINLTLKPGFNLVANQLKASPNNKLDTVLPAAPLETQVLKFANNNYSSDISDGTSWLDAGSGNPSTTTVAPGEGFFYFNPGFALVSSIVPQDISLTAANGFPQVLEEQYLTFNAMTQNYNVALINDGTGWLDSNTGNPADARPVVGQGFFIFNPGNSALNWARDFNPNTP